MTATSSLAPPAGLAAFVSLAVPEAAGAVAADLFVEELFDSMDDFPAGADSWLQAVNANEPSNGSRNNLKLLMDTDMCHNNPVLSSPCD